MRTYLFMLLVTKFVCIPIDILSIYTYSLTYNSRNDRHLSAMSMVTRDPILVTIDSFALGTLTREQYLQNVHYDTLRDSAWEEEELVKREPELYI